MSVSQWSFVAIFKCIDRQQVLTRGTLPQLCRYIPSVLDGSESGVPFASPSWGSVRTAAVHSSDDPGGGLCAGSSGGIPSPGWTPLCCDGTCRTDVPGQSAGVIISHFDTWSIKLKIIAAGWNRKRFCTQKKHIDKK